MIVSDYFKSILEGGMVGADFISRKLITSMTSVVIAYPIYKENIYLFAYSP